MMFYNNLATLVLILVILERPLCSQGLFEYICDEKELYTPYVHVFRGRKGERIFQDGPVPEPGLGFHVMSQENDIYVCINGPAYLYFARTTELGQVYEAPQPHVFSHTCEMYNVKPHSKATKLEFELHLMAVLLYGDPDDYRKPSIQGFTAPYFFDEDDYRKGFPKHYQNATSVAVIGQGECTLEKGDSSPTFPIKIVPKWKDVERKEVDGTDPGEKPEYENFLCRLGFSTLLSAAKGKPDEDVEKANMRVMINDERIRVKHCAAYDIFNEEHFNFNLTDATAKQKTLQDKWAAPPTVDERTEAFKKSNDAAVERLTQEIKKIDDKLAKTVPAPPSAAEKGRLDKKKKELEKKKDDESAKVKEFGDLLAKVKDGVDKMIAGDWTLATQLGAAKDANTAIETAKKDLETAENAVPPVQTDIIAKRKEVFVKEEAAYKAVKALQEEFSKLTLLYETAGSLLDLLTKRSVYKVGPWTPAERSKKRIEYVPGERSQPAVLTIDGAVDGKCEQLPTLNGPMGECTKGKPDKDRSCDLFKVALGKTNPWKNKADEDTSDAWKKEILDLTGGIFVTACPYLPNRRKFVKLINLLLGYYLTTDVHFNAKSTAGTSDACRAFQAWKKDHFSTGAEALKPNDCVTDPNTQCPTGRVRREFWDILINILKDCQAARKTMTFVDKSKTYGRWVFVKPGENRTEVNIEPYREQAEKEYVFNWVIDMAWRIFGTVLGVCMPTYETKIPLISSRFYSLFTEDFLIPLRETWINTKDNLVFQWILGEFYNGDAENWAELCMESSYFYSEREDYRPLRSLLVNCASEHNYFITGRFVGQSGRYIANIPISG